MNRLLVYVVLWLMTAGSQAYAVSWTDGFETGYTASRELVKSPWVQQTNDGHLINPSMVDLDLHVSSGDWWMNAYSGAWCVGQYGYHWGLVSRPTGALPADMNVVAKFVTFNQSDSAQILVLSPLADHNGRHWMTVPGSVGLNVDFYTQTATVYSVNSTGVSTSKVMPSSIGGWQWWRLVAPKASGAQTVAVEKSSSASGPWSLVETIDVDLSFRATHLGLGLYSAGFVDNVSFSSDSSTIPSNLSVANARQSAEGTLVQITSGVVCGSFTDFFYVEAIDRACGIRVHAPGHGLVENQLATSIIGNVMTSLETGERYIEATHAAGGYVHAIDPLVSSNRSLAGADLPTTGLLVKASGKATNMADGTYKLNDGSGVDLRFQIATGAFTMDPAKTYVVTGPMSLYKDPSSGNVVSLILVRDAASKNYIQAVGEGSTWKIGEPIVSYWAGPGNSGGAPTNFNVAQLATGGWNAGWDNGWSRTREPKYLGLYNTHGVRVILSLSGFVGLWEPLTSFDWDNPTQTAELDNLINKLRNDPALYAYFLCDEPGASRFPFFGKFVAHLRKLDPTRPTIVNLLPTYATADQIGVPTYAEYLGQFMEVVRPDMITYDNYPFTGVGGYDWSTWYFWNLEVVRKAAVKAGVPFGNFPQASPFYAWSHIATEGEVRWQTYTSLAYGVQGIFHFVYNEMATGMGLFAAPYDYQTPLPIWYKISEMNREFVAIGEVIQPLKCLAAYHTGPLPSGAVSLPTDSPFTVQPTGANQGFVLGCFTRSGAITHVLVVNKNYVSSVGVTLNGPGAMDQFDTTTHTWTQKTSSVLLNLPPGGGALLRLR